MVQPNPSNAFPPSIAPSGFSCWGFFTSVHFCDKAKQAATVLRSRGVLGHTQLKTSQRYSQLSNETLLAAVDASANAAGTNWGPAQTAKAGENPALVEA